METNQIVYNSNANAIDSLNSSKPDGKKEQKKTHSMCLFERSASTIFNLKYDSKVLEDYYQECSMPRSNFHLRFSAAFSLLICVVLFIYFCMPIDNNGWRLLVLINLSLVYASFFGVTYATGLFRKFQNWIYISFGIFVSICALLPFVVTTASHSLIINLFLNIQVIMLLYTTIAVRLWQAIILSTLVTIAFLVLVTIHFSLISWRILSLLVLINLVAQLVGLVHHLTSQARRRAMFLKLGLSAKLSCDLHSEQKSKEDMIKSLMPADVAKQVMNSQGIVNGDKPSRRQSRNDMDSSDDELTSQTCNGSRKYSQIDVDVENNYVSNDMIVPPSLVSFRKFHVSQMKNVSILFADIVGFTKMSSNTTATKLVFLLNELFGSFDDLCEKNGCEKIATLGDCYYCVSGCPKEEPDHAERCVEMGRSMCLAITQFKKRHNVEIDMRVGVHTGSVICGIVGTHRFKFDVWSHDVTLSNEMESSGEAGRVHISADTYEFVKHIYEVEEAESVPDIRKLKVLVEYFNVETQSYAIKHEQDKASIKTYFILKRFDERKEILQGNEEDNATTEELLSESQLAELPNNNNNSVRDTDATIKLMIHSDNNPKLRQQSIDMEMVTCFKEENSYQKRTFFEPKINPFTLNFKNPEMEAKYQQIGLKKHAKKSNTQLTLASHCVTPLVMAIANCVFSLTIILASFIGVSSNPNMAFANRFAFYASLTLTVMLNIVFLVPLIIDFVKRCNISPTFDKFYRQIFNCHFRNVYGILMIAMPSVLVLCQLEKCWFQESYVANQLTMGFMLLFMLSNCTLFNFYSSWTSSCVATVLVIVTVALLSGNVFVCERAYDSLILLQNATVDMPIWMTGNSNISLEIMMVLTLTLVYIWFFNREMDINIRATFSSDYRAIEAGKAIAQERQQVDWLLENIIPSYVIEDIKKYKGYSKHMTQVGVIFATITNFSDFYDEQFQGGREMLRVLNEIFADFENLLQNKKYNGVQKIKTIGACFMAASGLDPNQRPTDDNDKQHLYALMDFSSDLIATLNAFNEQLFNFKFEMKIGYNIGDVTAGVVGTTKLLYDIWGDTVNVSSRMYSTGEKGRIQVTEAVAQVLSNRYEFKYRGEVEVKGKGIMQTFLLAGKKRRENGSITKSVMTVENE